MTKTPIEELTEEVERLHGIISACDTYIDELHEQIIALTSDLFRLRKDLALYETYG